MAKKTRIKDIAAACGVSIAAVSRALKGQPGLGEETRQRILTIAQAEGYDFGRLRSGRIKRLLFCCIANTISPARYLSIPR